MSFIENEQNLITFALILIVILGIISYNLYVNSNYDINGNNLGCFDTIRNVFGFLPIIGEGINATVDVVTDIVDTTKDVIEKETEEVKKVIKKVTRKKEVFNIDSNNFTYDEAPYVCQAYDSKLATYDQVINAHQKGAHWCNYGWSANQMALYPTQKKIWKSLQSGSDEVKNSCGKPGVNGGHFEDKKLKFGVNCYGYKPKPDPTKIVYHHGEISDEDINVKRNDLLNKFKQMIDEGKLDIRPFNKNKWSNYSYKKSTYIINPNKDNDEVNIEEKIADEDKDPNSLDVVEEEFMEDDQEEEFI